MAIRQNPDEKRENLAPNVPPSPDEIETPYLFQVIFFH